MIPPIKPIISNILAYFLASSSLPFPTVCSTKAVPVNCKAERNRYNKRAVLTITILAPFSFSDRYPYYKVSSSNVHISKQYKAVAGMPNFMYSHKCMKASLLGSYQFSLHSSSIIESKGIPTAYKKFEIEYA